MGKCSGMSSYSIKSSPAKIFRLNTLIKEVMTFGT